MLAILKVLFLIVPQIFLVQCLIPTLTMRQLDQKTIQRKRQDTLEMCRIFNAETGTTNVNSAPEGKRNKRSVSTSDTLKEEEAARVEKIVDKLYDDMAEKGLKVNYRRRIITSTDKRTQNAVNASRRFNFAPAFVEGPDGTGGGGGGGGVGPGPHNILPVPIDWFKEWKHGIVPYFIDPKTYDETLQSHIVAAFDYFEKATCIRMQRLREKPTDQKSLSNVEWVYITNPAGIRQCVHSNERLMNIGVQMVVLGYECMSLGEIVHEVMHILGFPHEHTRRIRDLHITIAWDNIKPGYKKYFEIKEIHDDKYCTEHPEDKECLLANLPYDHSSIMHYPPRAFSKNGKATIKAKDGVKLGQREGLSEMDVQKVSLVYDSQCVERNKEYLLATCPIVNHPQRQVEQVSDDDIDEYFKDRLWSHGKVTYKFRNAVEFSAEEKENLKNVFKHIEKLTCIKFSEELPGDNSEENTPESLPTSSPTQTEAPASEENTPEITTTPSKKPSTTPSKKPSTTPSKKPSTTPSTTPYYVYCNEAIDGQGINCVDINGVLHYDPYRLQVSEKDDSYVKRLHVPDTSPEGRQHDEGSDKEGNGENVAEDEKNKTNEDENNNTNHADSYNTIVDDSKNRVKRSIDSLKDGRRHGTRVLVLQRTSKPGCKCPEPGAGVGGSSLPDLPLELSVDCFNSVNDLIHVFVHVLGLDHQHKMHDRDQYIKIDYDQLSPEATAEMKGTLPPAASVGFPYDYQSVMHFPWLQIKNGVQSIIYPIWNDGWLMGNWRGLSATDAKKINKIYDEQCKKQEKVLKKAANKGRT